MIFGDKDINDLKVLITEEEIQKKLVTLAEDIEKIFPENEEIYTICVLKGSVMFCTDLVKHIKRPVQTEMKQGLQITLRQ